MIKRTQDQVVRGWPSYSSPTVSVCCISFNHQEFMSEALDSFLVQETSFPFEIIVRDDASQDSTQKILMAYEKKYPKIIKLIIEKKNQYSKGIRPFSVTFEKSRGKYLAMCDGDDYSIDSGKLQIQFEYVFPVIEEILMYEEKSLAKFLNHALFRICQYLGLTPNWHVSSELDKNNDLSGQEKVLSICKELGADHYINVPGGRALYDIDSFAKRDVRLSFIGPEPIEYPQFGGKFVPYLSIIDVMMFNDQGQYSKLLQEYSLD